MCVCALCQRESCRKARLRTSQTIFRAWEREIQREDREGQDLWKNVEVVQQLRVRMWWQCEVNWVLFFTLENCWGNKMCGKCHVCLLWAGKKGNKSGNREWSSCLFLLTSCGRRDNMGGGVGSGLGEIFAPGLFVMWSAARTESGTR
jgi:hypothetical protein